MKLNKKFGFTLAELLVVLAVLGVIAAVLVPTVFQAMPDENKLRFKKGHYTLKRVIDGMVNSQEYQTTNGQFGRVWADTGSAPYTAYKFCGIFTDMLNTTYAKCPTSNSTSNYANSAGLVASNFDGSDLNDAENQDIDAKCTTSIATSTNKNAVTQDGITWWLPWDTFSGKTTDNAGKSNTTYGNVPTYYAIVCMDVDKVGSGETPFGFGVRRDGKVIPGYKAKTWLEEGTENDIPLND